MRNKIILSAVLASALFAGDEVVANEATVEAEPKAEVTAPVAPEVKVAEEAKVVEAVVNTPKPVAKKVAVSSKNSGKILAGAKVHHIFSGLDNGYDANTGSVGYIYAGYETASFNGLSAVLTYEAISNLATDDTKNIAHGMFVYDKKKAKTELKTSVHGLSDAFINYKAKNLNIQVGQFVYNSPLTKEAYSTVTNAHRAIVADYKINSKHKVEAGYISQMAYGARALASFGLIGEKTLTGGASKLSVSNRGTYYSMGEITGSKDNKHGAVSLGYSYGNKKSPLNINLQKLIVPDLLAQSYAEMTYKKPLNKAVKLSVSTQGLVGLNMTNKTTMMDNKAMIAGAKATLKVKKLTLIGAYNKSNSNTYINVWGGDPLYTTSIFSRNEYRPDVSAYKVTGKYVVSCPMGGKLVLVASKANYGQSSLSLAKVDATETDIVVARKFTKALTVKVFNVKRTTETNKEQNQTRLVAVYNY